MALLYTWISSSELAAVTVDHSESPKNTSGSTTRESRFMLSRWRGLVKIQLELAGREDELRQSRSTIWGAE
ncbi:MAG: hypothetical protein ACXV9R_03675 [Methylobacter sp.]